MSIPSIQLCLSVIEAQVLNSGIIHKKMVATLNIKGRDLLGQVPDIFNSRPLKDYVIHTLILDASREKFLCQDAFELCWTVAKA